MPTANYPPVGAIHESTIISALDIDMPEVMDKLYPRKADQWYGYASKIFQAYGFELPVSQETFTHYEDDDFYRPIETGGAVSAAAGASQAAFDITLAGTDVFTVGGNDYIFPRVNDVIVIPKVYLNDPTKSPEAVVTAVSPSTPKITVKFKSASQQIKAGDMPSGTKLFVGSGQFGEKSGHPESVVRNILKRTGRMQIIKETWEGSGVEMTNVKWFQTPGNGPLYYLYGQEQVDYSMMAKIEHALLFGTETDQSPGIVDPDSFNTGLKMNSTKGMYWFIRDNGGSVINYPVNGYTVSKWNTAAQKAEDNRAGDTFLVLHSFKLGVEIEDVLVDYLNQTNISYTSGDTDVDGKLVRVGFKQVTKSGVTFLFKKLTTLSNTNTYASSTDFKEYQHLAFCIPVGTKMIYDNENRDGARKAPKFGMRYKKLGRYSRRAETKLLNGTGASGQRPIREDDVDSLYTSAHIGFHGMCANQFQIWEGE